MRPVQYRPMSSEGLLHEGADDGLEHLGILHAGALLERRLERHVHGGHAALQQRRKALGEIRA